MQLLQISIASEPTLFGWSKSTRHMKIVMS